METSYWRVKRENINLKCKIDELRKDEKENERVISILIVLWVLTILLFIFF